LKFSEYSQKFFIFLQNNLFFENKFVETFKQCNYVKPAKVIQYYQHKSEKVKKVLTKKEPNLNPSCSFATMSEEQ
jgi:hypothetical protein